MQEKSAVTRKRMTIIFATIAIVSLVAVMPEVLNYAEFYRTVETFGFSLAEITVDTTAIQSGEAQVTVKFNATNPTSFAGIQVIGVICSLSFLREQSFQSLRSLNEIFPQPIRVEPFQSTTVMVNFTFRYGGEQQYEYDVRWLITYLQSGQQEILWMVIGQYTLKAYAYVFPRQIDTATYTTQLR